MRTEVLRKMMKLDNDAAYVVSKFQKAIRIGVATPALPIPATWHKPRMKLRMMSPAISFG
jgi:hypothetical protein